MKCDHIKVFVADKGEKLVTQKDKVIDTTYKFKYCPDCGKKLK